MFSDAKDAWNREFKLNLGWGGGFRLARDWERKEAPGILRLGGVF